MQSIGLLFSVFRSPAQVMFRVSKTPRVLAPIVFFALFSFLAASAVQLKVNFAELVMNMILGSPGSVNPDDIANLQQTLSLPMIRGAFFAGAVFMPILIIVGLSVLYFGLFTAVGREGSFKAFFSITAFAFMPNIFSQLVGVLRAFFVSPSLLMLDQLGSLGPALFVDRTTASPLLFAALSSVDLVSIWILSLLVIGYGFVTPKSMPKTKRIAVVVGVFAVYSAVRLAVAGLQGA